MKTYEEMTEEVLEKVKGERKRRRGVARKMTSVALSLVLVAGIVIAAGYTGGMAKKSVPPTPAVNEDETPGAEATGLSAKADYGEIFEMLASEADRDYYIRSNGGVRVTEKGDALAEVPTSNATAETAAPSEQDSRDMNPGSPDLAEAEKSGGDYSKTNVQVDGIDEADVVKTDGRYIYAVSRSNVYIISAEDGVMETVAKIPFVEEDGSASEFDGTYRPAWGSPDIYVTDDRLIVVSDIYEAARDEQGNLVGVWWYNNSSRYAATVYDISDRAAPSLIDAVSISGSGVSSRLADGKLYMIAEDVKYGDLDREDPSTFIPTTYANGDEDLVPVGSVYCGDEQSECRYLNVMEVGIADASVTGTLSLLGYDGDIMYQSENNIFVARADYKYDYEQTSENGVTTETSWNQTDTVLAKISVTGGLALVGSAQLDGYLHNSFSMDEYDGYLRVVTSVRRDEYVSEWRQTESGTEEPVSVTGTVYGDGDVGFFPDDGREYIKDDWSEEMYNNLYILDSALNVTGTLERLAPDERIYSCRFEGTDGYFVTYRETDPLFHVDLSDPTAPRVIDELKIPGHSDYLERFGDYLFGFGQDDDGNLKLSMFREDENGAMEEIAVTVFDGIWNSEALYDHHAILADADRGIICFGAEGWWENNEEEWKEAYIVVSWNGQEFNTVMNVPVDGWAENTRGFYIGDFLYLFVRGDVSADKILSYDLKTYAAVDVETMDEYVGEPWAEPEYVIFD